MPHESTLKLKSTVYVTIAIILTLKIVVSITLYQLYKCQSRYINYIMCK